MWLTRLMERSSPWLMVMLVSLACVGLVLVSNNLTLPVTRGDQFLLLAQSFLKGHLDFIQLDPHALNPDTSTFNGHVYWPLGPLPAVILMPGLWLFDLWHGQFTQGYASLLFIFATGWLVFKLARGLDFSQEEAGYWTLSWIAGSAFLGVAGFPASWYFSQVVTVFLLFASLYEYTTRRRWWVIGICFGSIALTRLPVTAGLLFVGLEIIGEASVPWPDRLKRLGQLVAPVAVALLGLAWYNWARFGNIFEQGYSLQYLDNPRLRFDHSQGLFSLVHVWPNVWTWFLSMPLIVYVHGWPILVNNPWGMSLVVTSPVLLFLVFHGRIDDSPIVPRLWLAVGAIALPLLFFFGNGFYEFGARYTLDFLPLVWYLLMRAYAAGKGSLSSGFKLLVACSTLVNLYFLFTYLR